MNTDTNGGILASVETAFGVTWGSSSVSPGHRAEVLVGIRVPRRACHSTGCWGSRPRAFDSAGLGEEGQNICVFVKFPRDAEAAGLGSML